MHKDSKKCTRRIVCLEYTLNHNQKKKHFIPQIYTLD